MCVCVRYSTQLFIIAHIAEFISCNRIALALGQKPPNLFNYKLFHKLIPLLSPDAPVLFLQMTGQSKVLKMTCSLWQCNVNGRFSIWRTQSTVSREQPKYGLPQNTCENVSRKYERVFVNRSRCVLVIVLFVHDGTHMHARGGTDFEKHFNGSVWLFHFGLHVSLRITGTHNSFMNWIAVVCSIANGSQLAPMLFLMTNMY